MEIVIWIIALNWGPTFLFLIYPLVMWLVFKDFKFEGFYGPFLKFRLADWGIYKGKNYPIAEVTETKVYLRNHLGQSFVVMHEDVELLEPWHAKAWADWGGVGLHWFMCYRNRLDKRDDGYVVRTITHEGTHCWQGVILGMLFWVLYKGHMLWIFVTQKIRAWWKLRLLRQSIDKMLELMPEDDKADFVSQGIQVSDIAFEWSEDSKPRPVLLNPYNKHPYLDCWAERMARKRAGQQVDIPPKDWPQGKRDLIPWW